jgi:hypothetical protein
MYRCIEVALSSVQTKCLCGPQHISLLQKSKKIKLFITHLTANSAQKTRGLPSNNANTHTDNFVHKFSHPITTNNFHELLNIPLMHKNYYTWITTKILYANRSFLSQVDLFNVDWYNGSPL